MASAAGLSVGLPAATLRRDLPRTRVAVSLSAVRRRHPTRRQHPPDHPNDRGRKSYRAGRPRSPRLGTIKKVTGVFLAYASPVGRTLIDRELHLPHGWCDAAARRAEAGIAAGFGFATKPALSLRMLERAITAGLPARWVTADEAYGKDSKFQTWLQQHRKGYVLAVPRNQRVPTAAGSCRPDVLAATAPALAWKPRICCDGAKGPRLYDWALATCPALTTVTATGC
ncbi:transposase [Micromonospora sp. NPDC049033]|uniref:transposase n=1 Tax=Micromonospora sp. NPDC049033 TaxID=3155149 RepID=UPI0033F61246